MAKIAFRHKSLKALQALEPLNSVRLDERIYQKILVGGQAFTQENASEHTEGIELLGRLMEIHRDFQQEAGEWEDMFGEYMEGAFQLNSSTSQFFTPMSIVRLMVKMNLAAEDLNKPEPLKICDPACGCGRFMLGVAEHYAESLGAFNFLMTNIDVDHRAFVYCCMNAILHNIPSINIWGNTLSFEVFDAYIVGIPGLQPWIRLEKEKARAFLLGSVQDRKEDQFVEADEKVEAIECEAEVVPEPVTVAAPPKLADVIVHKKSVQVGFDRW